MVEMHETARILHQHTPRSLIILDEVGRGTSTYDGISIAWSSIEFLLKRRDGSAYGPKVLFATHYFELTDLEGKFTGIRNYNVAVKEWQNEAVFLHKIVAGAADRSYGIHVAQLAGLPKEVIKRAYAILSVLEVADRERKSPQLDFFSAPEPQKEDTPSPSSNFLIELDKLDINTLTPIEALQLLAEWKKKIT
jgi:DNA mismatch repair protein MutS